MEYAGTPLLVDRPVEIRLNGSMDADLNWTDAFKKADASEGPLAWYLEMGLFRELTFPLSNEMQCKSLGLALEHLVKEIEEKYQERTQEVVLFNGSLDLPEEIRWNDELQEGWVFWLQEGFGDLEVLKREVRVEVEEWEALDSDLFYFDPEAYHLLSLFCRDVMAHYLMVLASHLPDSIPVSVHFNAEEAKSPWKAMQLLDPSCFGSVQVKGNHLPFLFDPKAPLGVCLPLPTVRKPSLWRALEAHVSALAQRKEAIRLVSEEHLTTQWHQLDRLLVDEKGLSEQGKRKLQGFEAAGGEVIFV